jgi:uncharacterized membrane protein YebE (DUF533 family)
MPATLEIWPLARWLAGWPGQRLDENQGKNALIYGGTHLVGGLAYKAWRDWQDGEPSSDSATPADASVGEAKPIWPPSEPDFLPSNEQQEDELDLPWWAR